MKIHKEGYPIIWRSGLFLAVLVAAVAWLFPGVVACIAGVVALGGWLFITAFFRTPSRERRIDDQTVFSPADGTVVVIEEVQEEEYFHERRLQVSVFMSIWNVHINWFPVGGRVDYTKHHTGRFLVAWHPKSSEENEHTTIVLDTGRHKILMRQIAGLVARRIVSYARPGESVGQNTQAGFIKFGSRVDILLPVDADVQVRLGDKVKGTVTPLARLRP